MNEKPLGIPYGIWILIFWLGFSALSNVVWVPIILYKDIEIATMMIFLSDMVIVAISLFVIYGLFKAKGWAWVLLISYVILDVVMAFISSDKLGSLVPALKMIFAIIVLFYLFQPGVKAYFEKT